MMKGMGIGIMYRDQVKSELKAGSLKTLRIAGLKRLTGKSFIVYRKGRPLSHNALDYLALLGGPRQKLKTNSSIPPLVIQTRSAKLARNYAVAVPLSRTHQVVI